VELKGGLSATCLGRWLHYREAHELVKKAVTGPDSCCRKIIIRMVAEAGRKGLPGVRTIVI
jgi:hypothetical protein